MVRITHYLYILSSWSLVAEDAIAQACAQFQDDVEYDWKIASTDYGGASGLSPEDLEFYYDRLEAATGVKMNAGWWRQGYNWTVPDRVATAAKLLGATGNETRIALARAALERGLPVAELDVAVDVAAEASGFSRSALRHAYDAPETWIHLRAASREFECSGVHLRPALILTNDLGDRVALSGIWTLEPIVSAISALTADDDSYLEFVQRRKALGLRHA